MYSGASFLWSGSRYLRLWFQTSKCLHEYTFNSMEQSSSWETNSTLREWRNIPPLWKPRDHYRVRKSLPLVRILRCIQWTPSHHIYVRSILILSYHRSRGSSSDLFSSNCQSKILYEFHTSFACCVFGPSQLPGFDHYNNIQRRAQIIKYILKLSLHSLVTFTVWILNVLAQTLLIQKVPVLDTWHLNKLRQLSLPV
jgi:hypothetical protein